MFPQRLIFFVLCFSFFMINIPYLVNLSLVKVRVVQRNVDSQFNIQAIDFAPITRRLLSQRAKHNNTTLAEFRGPQLLEPLVNQCFLYDDSQYIYRVCAFANVTQHEKSHTTFNFVTTSFHAILGIWREWNVIGQQFDSLNYVDGDVCEAGLSRKVKVMLRCASEAIEDLAQLSNVTEVNKCSYIAILKSNLFCDMGTVYSHLNATSQQEWDLLESMRQSELITEQGYHHYLTELLTDYGMVVDQEISQTNIANETLNNKNQLDLCKEQVTQLQNENTRLKEQLEKINEK